VWILGYGECFICDSTFLRLWCRLFATCEHAFKFNYFDRADYSASFNPRTGRNSNHRRHSVKRFDECGSRLELLALGILRIFQFGSHGQWRDHDVYGARRWRLHHNYSDIHELSCRGYVGYHYSFQFGHDQYFHDRGARYFDAWRDGYR